MKRVSQVLPLQKKRGGGQALAMVKGGGQGWSTRCNRVVFNMGA